MTTVATAIPDDLSLQAGDKLHLEAQVQEDGSFLVTRVVQQKAVGNVSPARLSLTDWVKTYAGTMKLADGETRESLRDSYLSEKFGR